MDPIPLNETFTAFNDLTNLLMPIMCLGMSISISLVLIDFISRMLMKNLQGITEDDLNEARDSLSTWLSERKRKAHDHLYLEHEPEALGTIWAETEDGEIVHLERKD